jgi:hypothetical protein
MITNSTVEAMSWLTCSDHSHSSSRPTIYLSVQLFPLWKPVVLFVNRISHRWIYHGYCHPHHSENEIAALPPDMLPVPRLSSQTGFLTGDLNEGRQAVLADLGMYLLIPYTNLVGPALSPPPEILRIRQTLTENGVLSAVQSTLPSKLNVSKDKAFGTLGDLISKIFEQVPSCSFSFTACSSQTPLSSRCNTSHPDAYIAHPNTDPRTKQMHWFDIAIPFEFKKGNSDRDKYDVRRNCLA